MRILSAFPHDRVKIIDLARLPTVKYLSSEVSLDNRRQATFSCYLNAALKQFRIALTTTG